MGVVLSYHVWSTIVWHKDLLHTLKVIEIRDSLLNWFGSYLLDRKQQVVIDDIYSYPIGILAGVPQGSISGPILFLTYFNSIVQDTECQIKLFLQMILLFIEQLKTILFKTLNVKFNFFCRYQQLKTSLRSLLVKYTLGQTSGSSI